MNQTVVINFWVLNNVLRFKQEIDLERLYSGNSNKLMMNKHLLLSSIFILSISAMQAQSIDAAISSVDIPNYVSEEGSQKITGTVKNFGTDELSSFDVVWTDGMESHVYGVTETLQTGESYNFTHPDEVLSVPTGFSANIVVSVEVAGDEDETNNSLNKIVEGIAFIPKKRVFGEEATGLWCGWCPRGMVGMEYMEEEYGDDWIGVAVHNGDVMENSDYDDWMGTQISGYPSGLVDRGGDIDPAWATLETAFEAQISDFGVADISLYPMLMDDEVTVRVELNFARDYGQDFRVAVLLAEDGIEGSGQNWAQGNYYAGGGAGALSGAGVDWHTAPSSVSGLTFNDVARQPITDVGGDASNLISGPSVVDNPVVTELDAFTWDNAYVMENTRVIALLINDNTGKVINAVESHLLETEIIEENGVTYYIFDGDTFQMWDDDFLVPTGVSAPAPAINVKVYPNPANGIINVALVENAEVLLIDMMGKVVARGSYTGTGNGVQLNSNYLSAGIYNVVVNTKNASVVERVTVIK